MTRQPLRQDRPRLPWFAGIGHTGGNQVGARLKHMQQETESRRLIVRAR